MRNIFKYIGIFGLMCLSFYYTNEVALLMKNDDAVMKEINDYALKHDKSCVEGYITEEGVVLGINGLVVNKDLSYSNMLGTGFDENLIKYETTPCVVSLENNKKDYIIGGNPSKNSVTLIINITNGKSIEEIVNISKSKDIKLSFLSNYKYLENNKEYVQNLINDDYDFLYKGESEEELSKYLKIYNSFNRTNNTFCVFTSNKNIINYCNKNNLNSIKTNKIYNKNYLSNVKSNLSKGDLIILEENVNLKNELGVTINYIKSRGLKIVNINEHLK